MQFKTLVLATALSVSSAAAAVLPRSGIPGITDLCGPATFEPAGFPAAAVSDCQSLIAALQSADTTSVIINNAGGVNGAGNIATQCQISFVGKGSFQVGNADMIDVITSAINEFGTLGSVSATGVMSCLGGSGSGSVPVTWDIQTPH